MDVDGDSYLYRLFAYLSCSLTLQYMLLVKHQQGKTENYIYRRRFFFYCSAYFPHYSRFVQPLHANEKFNFQVQISADIRQPNTSAFLWMYPRGNLYTTSNTPKHLCATVGLASGSTVKFPSL